MSVVQFNNCNESVEVYYRAYNHFNILFADKSLFPVLPVMRIIFPHNIQWDRTVQRCLNDKLSLRTIK